MKRYSQLADLESLLLEIPDENIRAYAGEAIASYSAGAYRSAIVSIWIAVVYDLYQKFRYLDEQFGDPAAKQCLQEIEKIRKNPDKKQVSAWERTILDKAFNNVKMLTSIEYEHLDRIQQDRHRCAHPVLDAEGFLFQPSPELGRSHIRTAIENLLSQPPIIGKAAGDALIRDVEGQYFPNDLEGVKNALFSRHLLPASDKYRQNLFKLCLKKILFLEPDNKWIIDRYLRSLECLIKEFRTNFESLNRATIKNIMEKTKDDRFSALAVLLNIEDTLWNETPPLIQEKFKAFLKQKDNERYKIYVISIFPEFKNELLISYQKNMNDSTKQDLIPTFIRGNIIEKAPHLVEVIVRDNIDVFMDSKTYHAGRLNAAEHIKPIIPILQADDIDYLINKIIERKLGDQLIDCAFVMEDVFKNTINKFPEKLPLWKEFYDQKKDKWGSMDNFEQLIANAEKQS